MSGWNWVILAYIVGYGGLAAYATVLAMRIKRTRQIIERAE